jgi:hydrogen peroxide-dependent heme synthase
MAAMKNRRAAEKNSRHDFPAAPLTLEGSSILHQMFRVRWPAWRSLDSKRRENLAAEASDTLAQMQKMESGQSALFLQLGHKGDLIFVHFRRSFDELVTTELRLANLGLYEFLEPASSYVSVVELGMYEATVIFHAKLAERGIRPHSPEWQQAVDAELETQRRKMAQRLYPSIPERRYLCFYPMNKKRDEEKNWYQLSMEERRRLMHEHGLIGRRYAGQVTQIISGSMGLDDWEWGVDLFADDPMVFKRLIYEMRFDEASAVYALFGPFFVGLRVAPHKLGDLLEAKAAP